VAQSESKVVAVGHKSIIIGHPLFFFSSVHYAFFGIRSKNIVGFYRVIIFENT
jgi:hypothetical protein